MLIGHAFMLGGLGLAPRAVAVLLGHMRDSTRGEPSAGKDLAA